MSFPDDVPRVFISPQREELGHRVGSTSRSYRVHSRACDHQNATAECKAIESDHSPANVIDALAGIPWKEINRRFKNDYDQTLAEVNTLAEASGHDPDAIRIEADMVMAALQKLAPIRGKRRRPPTRLKLAASKLGSKDTSEF